VNFGDVRRGLRVIFDRLAGTAQPTANSPDQPWSAPDFGTFASVSFKITLVRTHGRDEVRMTYDPDLPVAGDTYQPDPEDPDARLGAFAVEVVGQRTINVSVRVERDDNSDDATALPIAEGIRAGLKLPSVLSSLQDLGLGISRISDLRDLSYTGSDDRVTSVGQFDLLLTASSSIVDGEPVTTIEVVEFDEDSTP
jgi:hypothetical protein